MGVHLRQGATLSTGERYLIQTPEGKIIPFALQQLKRPDLSCATHITGGIALLDYIKGVGPKSLISPTTEILCHSSSRWLD